MKINDNEIKEQMRKMTYTMTTVGNLTVLSFQYSRFKDI